MKIVNTTKGVVNDYYVPRDLVIGDDFVANRQHFVVVTDEQAHSYEKVLRHQGTEQYQDAYYSHLDDYLAVSFDHIFIGIERDGYSHS